MKAFVPIVLLATSSVEEGSPELLYNKGGKHLFIVSIDGTATVEMQVRQKDLTWITIFTITSSDQINFDNYGWYEVRFVTTANTGTVFVTWSYLDSY